MTYVKIPHDVARVLLKLADLGLFASGVRDEANLSEDERTDVDSVDTLRDAIVATDLYVLDADGRTPILAPVEAD
jgi:hypothetical protein